MTTIIKRIKVNVEFDIGDSLECFYTNGDQITGEPPTIIIYNGQEYNGHVKLSRDENDFTIIIRITE